MADLIGANGTITWTAGLSDGTTAPAAANVQVVDHNLERGVGNTSRPGGLCDRVTVGPYRGTVTLRTLVTDAAAMPVPIATVGTLKIGFDNAPGAPTKYWTLKVVIVAARGVGYNAATGERPQAIDYVCRLTSTSTSDTVVAT